MLRDRVPRSASVPTGLNPPSDGRYSRPDHRRLAQRFEGGREVAQGRRLVDDPVAGQPRRARRRARRPRSRSRCGSACRSGAGWRGVPGPCAAGASVPSGCRPNITVPISQPRSRLPRTARPRAPGRGTRAAGCAAAAPERRGRRRGHRSGVRTGTPARAAPRRGRPSSGSGSAGSRGRPPRAGPAPAPRGRGRRARRRSGSPR